MKHEERKKDETMRSGRRKYVIDIIAEADDNDAVNAEREKGLEQLFASQRAMQVGNT